MKSKNGSWEGGKDLWVLTESQGLGNTERMSLLPGYNMGVYAKPVAIVKRTGAQPNKSFSSLILVFLY